MTLSSQVEEELRRYVEGDDWDSMHEFLSCTWDGTTLETLTFSCVDPSISPDDYPRMMAGIALEDKVKYLDVDEKGKLRVFIFGFEAYSTKMPTEAATPEELEQFETDRVTRQFRYRADAIECKMAVAADGTGRFWSAMRHRGEAEVSLFSAEPGETQDKRCGGTIAEGIRAVAWAMQQPVPADVMAKMRQLMKEE